VPEALMRRTWTKDQSAKNQALFFAAQKGFTEVVKALLEADTSPDPRHATLKTSPLIIASANGHIGIVRLLIQAGADIEAQDLA